MLKLGLPSWTGFQLVQTIDKNYETLPSYSLKNKESNKKNGTQFWAQMRENRPKQCNVFIIRGYLAEPVQPIEKIYETLAVDSSKNKESKKKTDNQFWAQMRENRPKQSNVFIKRGCLA